MSNQLENVTTGLAQGVWQALAGMPGLAAALLLIVLLIVKVGLQAIGNPQAAMWARRLNFALVPLLAVFTLIIAARVLDLLQVSP